MSRIHTLPIYLLTFLIIWLITTFVNTVDMTQQPLESDVSEKKTFANEQCQLRLETISFITIFLPETLCKRSLKT